MVLSFKPRVYVCPFLPSHFQLQHIFHYLLPVFCALQVTHTQNREQGMLPTIY